MKTVLLLLSLSIAQAQTASEILKSAPADALKSGTFAGGLGGHLVFAIATSEKPTLFVDDEPSAGAVKQAGAVYYVETDLAVGRTHSFYWMAGSARFGGRTDVAAWPPDAYEQPGVPQGVLSAKRVHSSSIYPNMKSDYWVYAAAGVDAAVAAPVMIWQDGEVNVERNGASHTLNTIDNLTKQGKIPPIVHVFISPGLVGQTHMRSIEYDTVNDTYPRFLRDEVLAEVAKSYKLRPDAYSRAIIGESSGGICAFNAAWQLPDQFSRVVSRIGSFAAIQWKPNLQDGGQSYPNKVRKEAKRNIRVWLQDGSQDLENEFGSWPLQNIQMANSLKRQGYDFYFSFGNGTHTRLGGQVEAPAELEWIWRGWEAGKTEQTYDQDPAEKDRPFYRVKALNR